MRTIERVLPIKRKHMARALRYLLDSLLACAGSLLVTGILWVFHLSPNNDFILVVYLPVVLALAIVRGRYAAILSAMVTSLALAYFTILPLASSFVYHLEEWIELSIYLIVAILVGLLATMLRERERDVRARASELIATFEAMTEGVSICDVRGEIRYTNAAYRSLLALEEDADPSLLQLDQRLERLAVRDLEGKPLPKERLPVLRVLQGERFSGAHTLDLLCRTYKGEDLILNVSGAPMRDTSGQVVGGVMAFRDVTERYRMEQQLKYSERKLRSLVDSNIFGMIVADLDGHIYEANDRFMQMVGYTKDELLSEAVTWRQLVPPDYQAMQAQRDQILLLTGVKPPGEKEYLRKDGSRVPVLVAGAMIDQERDHALLVIQDISERKEVERRKQEFLSMVSHELRTPLTSIMGFLDLALLCNELLPRQLSPEAEQLLDKMEKVLQRAMAQVEVETRLVEDMLEVSQLELNQFKLSLQPENLVTIVQEIVANQQQMARTRQIELILPPQEVVPVLADAGRVEQALTNYLNNALKYAPGDQPIAVRLEVAGNVARVSVHDRGPGLTPEQQLHVWERFYQVAAPGRHGPERIGTRISHRQNDYRTAPGSGRRRGCSWSRLDLLV